jgi:hypothetical protein
MNLMIKETCASCVYEIESRCHRFPPNIVGKRVDKFPVVELSDWCGEWEEVQHADDK